KLYTALAELSPEGFQHLPQDDQKISDTEIFNQLIEKLTENGFIAQEIQTNPLWRKNFTEIFRNSRLSTAIFTYCSHFYKNEKMIQSIRYFIQTVLEGRFESFRHENNSHRGYVTTEKKDRWET